VRQRLQVVRPRQHGHLHDSLHAPRRALRIARGALQGWLRGSQPGHLPAARGGDNGLCAAVAPGSLGNGGAAKVPGFLG
jgi:hypothetical protein